MSRSTVLAIVTLATFPSAAQAARTRFQLDGSGGKDLVSFVSDAPVEQFVGRTSKLSGTLEVDLANVEDATGEVSVDMASLDTGIEDRNEDMRRDKYLATGKFPKATFKIKKVHATGEKSLQAGQPLTVEITADLTLHGVTRPVTTRAVVRYLKGDKWSAQMIGPGDILSVGTSFPIKMTDFGIQVPKLLVLKVAAEVQINVRVNARTQPMPAGR